MLLFWIAVYIACVSLGSSSEELPNDRSRRTIFQFASMITYTTGRSAWDYNNYGCYCGLGGRGRTVDSIDRCCKDHDNCYAKTENKGCSPKWRDNYNFKRKSGKIICSRNNNICDMAACQCDRDAAHCFARYRYNRKYKSFSKSKC